RVRAQLRRACGELKEDSSAQMTWGYLFIDLDRYQAFVDDEDACLTRREFDLLVYLAKRAGKVVTRKQLLHDVWGYKYYGDVRTVDVTIRRLREKIERDPSNPCLIITRRGVGYIFVSDEES
ncbi:MAG: winged helix-turn-helix domain-containing protein, partial [Bacillota bacterium]